MKSDLIDRQAVLALPRNIVRSLRTYEVIEETINVTDIEQLPPAQPERDIPKKPTETTDRSWGIPHRQAVCPNCDSYLGTVHFLCEGDKRKVSYCESCGQAIDWEGWNFDE